MRESIEALKTKSIVHRLIYRVLKFGSGILPSGRRSQLRILFFKIIRHRPGFCRKVTEWGLNKAPRSPRIVVSLTSYPKRIGTVYRTIETLLTQDFKPDMVVLWLGEDKFANKEADIPQKLLNLRSFGLTIGWCKDIRSYTKLVPALRAYPNDIIVTADDDQFYRPDWLRVLYESYQRDELAVHCHLVNGIKTVGGVVARYLDWKYNLLRGSQSYRNLLMGVCGVLYPPGVLANDACDEAMFKKLAPLADDLWFWAMAVLNGRKIKLAEHASCTIVCDCAANNAEALMNTNMGPQELNDSQLSNIFEAYPIVKERLLSEV